MPTPFIRLAKTALLALPLALGLAAGATPAAAKGCEDLAAGRCKVKLPGGITMAYVETGPKDGPAVLLIHGLTDNIRSWSTTMAALHKRDPGLHILAMDREAEDGAGQRSAGLVHGEQFLAVQQLAARHAVGVEDEQLDHLDIGVLGQEILGFLHGGEIHGALDSIQSDALTTCRPGPHRVCGG